LKENELMNELKVIDLGRPISSASVYNDKGEFKNNVVSIGLIQKEGDYLKTERYWKVKKVEFWIKHADDENLRKEHEMFGKIKEKLKENKHLDIKWKIIWNEVLKKGPNIGYNKEQMNHILLKPRMDIESKTTKKLNEIHELDLYYC
jgi:hypothetical protein